MGHPLDLVKVQMQTAALAKDGKKQGTFQILRQIIKTEGVSGIYKGVGEFSSESFFVPVLVISNIVSFS